MMTSMWFARWLVLLAALLPGASLAQGIGPGDSTGVGPGSRLGCPLTGCTFTGPVNTTLAFDHSVGSSNYRPNLRQTTLTPSVSTTNIFENSNSFLYLNGPGTATGEINLNHTYFENELGANAASVEGYEASNEIFGTVGTYANYLALNHNASTGTATTLIGYRTNLVQDNATAGSIATYVGLQCNAMTGAGSAPTSNLCIQNKDPTAGISTLGRVAIGSQAVPPASQALSIFGIGATSATFSTVVKNSALLTLFSIRDDNVVAVQGSLNVGTSGSVVGTVSLANATSGTVKLAPPAGALGAAILTTPDVTDTLAVLGTSQTHTAVQTFSGTANFSGVLQGNGVAGVSCAAASVTLATLVVSNGIVSHC
jgi:hypothetical protein